MPEEFQRTDRHVHREIAGEHLLIALHGDSPEPLFALTPTAALLWDRLAEWTSVDALALTLVERFEVEREHAAADVSEFLQQLADVGAVERREAGR